MDRGRPDVCAAGALVCRGALMSELQIYIVLGVFAVVILAIAFNWLDMMLAVLIGSSILIAFGIFNDADLHEFATAFRGG